jgi:hypothetical protein
MQPGTLPPATAAGHSMWFFHKRRFEKLVDEKKALHDFSQSRAELEKGDLPAILIAALVTFIPPVAVIAGVIFLASWLLS